VLPATSLTCATAVQRIAGIRDPMAKGFARVRTERSPRVNRTSSRATSLRAWPHIERLTPAWDINDPPLLPSRQFAGCESGKSMICRQFLSRFLPSGRKFK